MIHDYRGIHEGETALIVGNGPSLDKTPLHKLGEKYISFGANKIFNYPFTPTYYSVIDKLMLEDCLPLQVSARATFAPLGADVPDAVGLPLAIAPKFSTDLRRVVYMGGTVTFVNLQLAAWMGFRRVLLVGIDHRYPGAGRGVPGEPFEASGKDADHFRGKNDVDYFEPGKTYNRPELDVVASLIYPLALPHFERIVNLTPDTALDVFEKGKAAAWL